MTTAGLARRLVERHFATRDGELVLGGVSVRELAERFGTPLYVYDATVMRAQLGRLREAIPARVEVFFSVKANPNVDVLRVFVGEGAGLEIASASEYLRARAAGCAPDRIVFAGPGKGREELARVIEGGVGEIHLESEEEIALVDALAGEEGRRVRVALRVNPRAAGGAMQMGGQSAPFGFDEERLEEVARLVLRHPRLDLVGLHLYGGTQMLRAEVVVAQWEATVRLGLALAQVLGRPLESLDFGGGLGVPYFGKETELDLAAVQRGLGEKVGPTLGDPALAGARLVVEPGRFLVGPAGVYVTGVRAVKTSRGKTYVVTDGGMHHHLAASGNLGQVIKKDYPLVHGTRAFAPEALLAVVTGPLCTPLDTIGRAVELPETRAGDLVCVLQSGAYGLSASPVGFLSHPMPAEVLVGDGEPRVVRSRGTFEEPLVGLPG
ncbi:MAG: type III PLP-dependent enzyme [Labilithrix sp.]|nr:type III PLP-dependent enzyme [Labilithrix sp.]